MLGIDIMHQLLPLIDGMKLGTPLLHGVLHDQLIGRATNNCRMMLPEVINNKTLCN